MFSLHESTKIRLCRAGFVALCAAPLCAVLAWSVVVRCDWYRQTHERAIAQQLGWSTRLAGVSSPQPHLLLYRDLELADPHHGQLLARLPYVEIVRGGDAVTVRLPYPAIVNGTRFDVFWQVLRDLARTAGESRPVNIEASNLTVHLDDGDQSFTELSGRIDGSAGQVLAKLSFCRAVAGDAPAQPCEVMFTRRQHAGARVHSLDLSTGETPLPVTLIASIWPGVQQFGKTCSFVGRLCAIEQGGTWRTELTGHLARIDLDTLLGPFPHKLSGIAAARLDRVTIVGGRLESAAGSVMAGPGVISRSLVQSAETHLHVRAARGAVEGRSNLLGYEQLAAGFEMSPHGMTLRGAVPGTKGGLLVDDRYVLVEEAPVSSQPVVDLVRTLVPKSDVQVPATRETVVLTSTLPVPSIMPEPGREEPLLQARPLNVVPRPAEPPLFRR